MKKTTVNLAIAASLFSASALAAQPQLQNMHCVGSVAVSAMTTLNEIEKGIAEQAQAKNASHYRIISVSGNNKLPVSAVIYR
ncbi:Multiple stress resistance protein BhsA precursor [Yersinia frederiksenii]|uniref:YdgH/BhsA/McbA-like domain containing protein n=1 Tax=Yersinia frederiksenii TaxID=29484 RepID=UPI0005DFBC76|nr:YdgH/BhsA/McbA-like domain containing protein [Yersinia frederiksenii]CNC37914.1 Multiple stress resistance protein BhsA precursor [Yersinia frederiksenii]